MAESVSLSLDNNLLMLEASVLGHFLIQHFQCGVGKAIRIVPERCGLLLCLLRLISHDVK